MDDAKMDLIKEQLQRKGFLQTPHARPSPDRGPRFAAEGRDEFVARGRPEPCAAPARHPPEDPTPFDLPAPSPPRDDAQRFDGGRGGCERRRTVALPEERVAREGVRTKDERRKTREVEGSPEDGCEWMRAINNPVFVALLAGLIGMVVLALVDPPFVRQRTAVPLHRGKTSLVKVAAAGAVIAGTVLLLLFVVSKVRCTASRRRSGDD